MKRNKLINTLNDEDIISDKLLSEISDLVSLRNLMRDLVNDEGSCVCPLCNHKTIKYKRSMNNGQFYFLIHLSSKWSVNQWVHYNQVKTESNSKYHANCTDYALLEKFGLIKLHPKKDKNDTIEVDGLIKLTDDGKKFLRGKLTIPKKIYIVNNNRIGESDERVNFTQCQKKFRIKDIF